MAFEPVSANKGPMIVAVTVSMLVMTFFFFILRLFVRLKFQKKLMLDDWFLLASFVSTAWLGNNP